MGVKVGCLVGEADGLFEQTFPTGETAVVGQLGQFQLIVPV